MTLVKSFHSGDPAMVQKHEDMQVPDIQGMSLASAVRVKAVKSSPGINPSV